MGNDMTPLDELAKLISEKGRKILVAQNPEEAALEVLASDG